MSYYFYALFTWLSAVLFILAGVFGILIPFSAEVRTSVVQFIFEQSFLITIIGIAFILIGLFLMIAQIRSGSRYLKTVVGKNPVTVDPAVVQGYIDSYWKELFPKEDISSRFVLKKRKLNIYADLPFMPKEEQKPLSERIGEDLGDIMHRLVGYPQKVVVYTRFQKKE